MADGPLSKAQEWGQYLASLPSDDRDAAIRASKLAYASSLPADELDKPPVHTLGEFLATEISVPPILVAPGLVARGALTAMISKGGKGKTTLSFNRLLRWSVGRPLFDELPDVMKPTSPLRSLIIENEGGGWHTQNKLRTMLGQCGLTEEEQETAKQNVNIWGDGGWSSLRLDDPANLETVKRGVEACKPDILFLEPFRLLWRGEENSSTEMLKVLESFYDLANTYNIAVMVTHHESKGGVEDGGDAMEKARGSTVFSDLGAVMERWASAGQQREWSLTKWRFDDPPAPVRMTYDRETEGYRYVSEDESQRKVVTCLYQNPGSWMTVHDVRDELDTGESLDTVRRWLNKAYKDDAILRRGVPGGGAHQFCVAEGADEDDNNTAPLPVS